MSYPIISRDDFYSGLLKKKEFLDNAIVKNSQVPKEAAQYSGLEPQQKVMKNFISPHTPYNGLLVFNETGTGKCLGKDTPVLMYDGSIKMVQDIKVGEQLMGDDSTPRTVFSLATGREELFKVDHVLHNESYIVNKSHILTLKNQSADIIDIPLKDYLQLSADEQQKLQGFKVGVKFSEKDVPVDPYLVGLWLKEDQNNELRIPDIYKINSRKNRLKLLAGLLDANSHTCFEIYKTSKDIVYLCNSLGFICKIEPQRISIFGQGLKEIPIQYPRTSEIYQNPPEIGITVTSQGEGDYYGFTLDGNGRFLLGNFIVTHNTGAAIAIAEQFKDYIKKTRTRILVLVKNDTIARNFKLELQNEIFTGGEYLSAEDRAFLQSAGDSPGRVEKITQLKKIIKKRISKIYEIVNYGAFTNRVLGYTKKKLSFVDKELEDYVSDAEGSDLSSDEGSPFSPVAKGRKGVKKDDKEKKISKKQIKTLNNRIIIVDEAHNITLNDHFLAIFKLLQASYNTRVILLTATPMFDTIDELPELLNIILPPGQKLPSRQVKEKYKLFENKPIFSTKEQASLGELNISLKIPVLKDGDKKILSEKIKGLVSYLRVDSKTFPKRVDMGTPLYPERSEQNVKHSKEHSILVVKSEMSQFQWEVVQKAQLADLHEATAPRRASIRVSAKKVLVNSKRMSETNKPKKKQKSPESPKTRKPKVLTGSVKSDRGSAAKGKHSVGFQNTSDATTFVSPQGNYGTQAFQDCFVTPKTNKEKAYIKERLTGENLRTYSCKIYDLLQNLKRLDTQYNGGTAFIFSGFVTDRGVKLIAEILKLNGYSPFTAAGEGGAGPKFAVLVGGVQPEERERIRLIFNDKNNIHGENIKILLASPIFSEGITLKNTRQIYLLEPAWNMSRNEQVAGRGIRNRSHMDITNETGEANPVVEVLRLAAVAPKKDKNNKWITVDSIDIIKYKVSDKKDRAIKKVERILKENAFDCALFRSRNILGPEHDYTRDCDYKKCDYPCASGPLPKGPPDLSTWGLTIDPLEFNNSVNRIIELFHKKSPVWTYNQIIEHFDMIMDPLLVQLVLDEIINNPDKYKISFSKQYYVLKPLGVAANASLYQRLRPEFVKKYPDFDFDTYIAKLLDKRAKRPRVSSPSSESSPEKPSSPGSAPSSLRRKKKRVKKSPPKGPTGQTIRVDNISIEDRRFNENVVQKNKVYGTMYEKTGLWDGKFRIVDSRALVAATPSKKQTKGSGGKTVRLDKRKIPSGRVCGQSIQMPEIQDVAKYLKINIGPADGQKKKGCSLLKQEMIKRNLVLRPTSI